MVLNLLYITEESLPKARKIKANACVYTVRKLMFSNSFSDFILTSIFQVTNSRLSHLWMILKTHYERSSLKVEKCNHQSHSGMNHEINNTHLPDALPIGVIVITNIMGATNQLLIVFQTHAMRWNPYLTLLMRPRTWDFVCHPP